MLGWLFCCCKKKQKNIDNGAHEQRGYGSINTDEHIIIHEDDERQRLLSKPLLKDELKEESASKEGWKKQVEEVRGLEELLYGETQTPTADQVVREWWQDQENVQGYMGKLQHDLNTRLIKQVEQARSLERQAYGEVRTLAFEQVDKMWWYNQKNATGYLQRVQSDLQKLDPDLRLARQVTEARSLEKLVYGYEQTPLTDQVNKTWWENPYHVSCYFEDLFTLLAERMGSSESLSVEGSSRRNSSFVY